jgi:hypothetical protein
MDLSFPPSEGDPWREFKTVSAISTIAPQPWLADIRFTSGNSIHGMLRNIQFHRQWGNSTASADDLWELVERLHG